MYNPKFSEFKENFLNDPKVISLMSQLEEIFERGFKEEIIDQLDEEEVYESIETIWHVLRDDNKPEDYTIFDILIFRQ